MEAAFFCASDDLTPLLEPDVHPLTQLAQLTERRWDLLVLTRAGCAALAAGAVACGCGTLLLPGDRGAPAALGRIRAERVVGYGLSPPGQPDIFQSERKRRGAVRAAGADAAGRRHGGGAGAAAAVAEAAAGGCAGGTGYAAAAAVRAVLSPGRAEGRPARHAEGQPSASSAEGCPVFA